MTDLRSIIAKRREELGISVSELARKAEMSRPTLSNYLNGPGEKTRDDMTGASIGKLFDALGIKCTFGTTSSKGKQ